MRWRVTTLTDCGVSRGESFSPVAAAVTGVMYDPVPSVVSPVPVTVTLSSIVTPPAAAPGIRSST
ncbi:hypothetical protein D3C78_1821630 [compost metagenome]